MEAVFNRHAKDFRCDFTIEFDVKFPPGVLPEEEAEFEFTTGTFTNKYSQRCYNEIMKSDYSWIKDWSFAGRSNGWWVLECYGDKSKVRTSTIHRIESIVERYFNNYGKEIEEYYKK